MGKRRMVNIDIIDMPYFMELSLASQMGYIRLLTHADDEGFVCNPKLIGVGKISLKALEEAGLIFCFRTGPILIRHWLQHNLIRKDTFKSTNFAQEKAQVTLDKNKIYRLKTDTDTERERDEAAPQDNINKPNSIQPKKSKAAVTAAAAEDACGASLSDKKSNFDIFWDAYPKKVGHEEAQLVFMALDVDFKTIMEGLDYHKRCNQWISSNGVFVPDAHNWLRKKGWENRPPLYKSTETAAPVGAAGGLGLEELAAIRRTLAEVDDT